MAGTQDSNLQFSVPTFSSTSRKRPALGLDSNSPDGPLKAVESEDARPCQATPVKSVSAPVDFAHNVRSEAAKHATLSAKQWPPPGEHRLDYAEDLENEHYVQSMTFFLSQLKRQSEVSAEKIKRLVCQRLDIMDADKRGDRLSSALAQARAKVASRVE